MQSLIRCSVWLLLTLSGGVRAAESLGQVTGRIRFIGEPPQRLPIVPPTDQGVCGAQGPITSDELLVDGGGLANAVVTLLGVGAIQPAAPQPPSVVTAENCVFRPRVQTVTSNTTIELENRDAVLHNVHGLKAGKTVFNVGLPPKGKRVKRALKSPGVVTLKTDSGHPWMRAYFIVVPHRLHAVTRADGSFAIADVPPGQYQVRVWHESLGEKMGEVTVTPGAPATFEVSFDASTLSARAQTGSFESRLQALEGTLREQLEKTKSAMEALAAQQSAQLAVERRARVLAEGRATYLRHCATCHGERGDGLGESAPFLSHPPRNFLNGDYQFRMTPSGTLAREEDVFRTISVGVLGTPMPAWKDVLSYEQRRLLAQYVLALSPRSLTEVPGAPIEIGDEPPNDGASIERGKAIYQQIGCKVCHGPEGRGDGITAGALTDAWGKPIRPWDFTRPYFQGGKGAAVVFRAVSTGLSGSPMPSFFDSLDTAQRWDLAHFIVSLGQERSVGTYLFEDGAGRIQVP